MGTRQQRQVVVIVKPDHAIPWPKRPGRQTVMSQPGARQGELIIAKRGGFREKRLRSVPTDAGFFGALTGVKLGRGPWCFWV